MEPINSIKLRVLFVGSFFDKTVKVERGGQNVSCETLINSPIRDYVEFIPFDTTNSSIPPPPVSQRLMEGARRLARFIKVLWNHKPQVALIYCSGGLSFFEKVLMSGVAKIFGVPVLLSVRAGAFQDRVRSSAVFRLVARGLLQIPTAVLCQSESWARFYTNDVGMPRKRLTVVYNWINLESFVPQQTVYECSLEAPFRLLFVGWVNRSKGIFELLESMRRLAPQRHITLDVVGKGNQFEEALSMVERDPVLASIVRFHGWLSGQSLLSRYNAADVLVLPTYAEGFPNVVLEAMAMALPIITTPVGGIPDVIQSGRNGLLIEPRSTDSLTQAIEFMIDNPNDLNRFGVNNRKQVMAQHDIGTLWPHLLDVLCRLTGVDNSCHFQRNKLEVDMQSQYSFDDAPLESESHKLGAFAEVSARQVYWRVQPLQKLYKKLRAPKTSALRYIDLDRLAVALSSVGVCKGACLMVHSSIDGLGLRVKGKQIDNKLQVASELLKFLEMVIGESGTLVMPTHPHYRDDPGFMFDKSKIILTYDPARTPSKVGLLTEVFRRSSGALRSYHPLSSVVAKGPRAKEIVGDFPHEGDLPHGLNSPYKRFYDADGIVIGINVSFINSLTMVHVAEELRDDKWPVSDFFYGRNFNIVKENENIPLIVRERRPTWVRYISLRALNKDLIQQGVIDSQLVDGISVDRARAKAVVDYMLAKNARSTYPYFFIPKVRYVEK